MSGNYDKSNIDNLFYELYGFYPNKAGQSYEMLVAAAFKLLFNKDVSYDQRIRGEYSQTVYQLDGVIHHDPERKMVEAKDYTILGSKVGRGDIQKLQGALTDLPVGWGVFASATGYTSPAKKYAISSSSNPLHKPIDLYNIRPSIAADKYGRINKIVVQINMFVPNYDKATMVAIWTEEAKRLLLENGRDKNPIEVKVDRFYNSVGETLQTIEDLTMNNQVGLDFDDENHIAKGCWIVRDGHILSGNVLYPILGIEYSVPTSVAKSEMIIESEGEPKLYIKAEDGTINKLISDKELKKVTFKEGKVVLRN